MKRPAYAIRMSGRISDVCSSDLIGLEQVGGQADAVADIVADSVGDHRGIAWIVLGNAGLDLADEVGADVGGLGEEAAAEAREERDQRSAEGERDERVDDGAVDRKSTRLNSSH